MYCERCRRLTEGEKCPECGKKCAREVRAEDPCFLFSAGQIWADMACEVLENEHIPHYKEGALGAAITALTGYALETYSVYVPYAYFERAAEIRRELFESPEAEEETDAPGEERESEDD